MRSGEPIPLGNEKLSLHFRALFFLSKPLSLSALPRPTLDVFDRPNPIKRRDDRPFAGVAPSKPTACRRPSERDASREIDDFQRRLYASSAENQGVTFAASPFRTFYRSLSLYVSAVLPTAPRSLPRLRRRLRLLSCLYQTAPPRPKTLPSVRPFPTATLRRSSPSASNVNVCGP